MDRAYSLLTIKAIDDDQRVITGIASTPITDRMGDIVEPKGAEFKLPLPLLWQHDSHAPIGEVFSAKVTATGIEIKARVTKVAEPGTLKDRLDEAWQSITHKLVKGFSIGFQAIESSRIEGTFGMRFLKWMWLETSVVTIPANADATIHTIKHYDTLQRAATGTAGRVPSSSSPAVVGSSIKKEPYMGAPISDQIVSVQSELRTKSDRLTTLIELEGADGSLEDAQVAERDALTPEVKNLSGKVERLKALEAAQGAMAKTVIARAPQGDVRDPQRPHVEVGDGPEKKLPPGIEFARAVICRGAALKTGVSAIELAKHYYPDLPRIQTFLKEAIPAGSTLDSTWAGPLVYAQNLVNEFIEFLRPQTIIGRIDSFTRVPFNSRITGQTSGGAGYWVGQGKAKPLTKYDYNAVTIPFTKVANITVLTDELVRFSSPSAETNVRNQLAASARERLDIDFIDPAKTASAGVSPASITNGITNLNSAGVTLDSVDVDVQAMMNAFIQNHIMPTHWIMPNTVALALSLMRTSLGNYAFPTVNMNGGTFYGLPVVTSQYAILGTPANNLIVLLSAPDIFLADDGGFAIDISREASLEMDDAPTMDAGSLGSPAGAVGSVTVSMFQTNSLAVRCERMIYWARRRDAGVVWMDDVQWAAGTQ